MNTTLESIAALGKIQDLDAQARAIDKQIDELPQKQAILDLRAKKAELTKKGRALTGLRKDAEMNLKKFRDEDSGLLKKSEAAQRLIDTAGGDFRSINLHSKELAGYEKRRETIRGDIESGQARVEEILGLEAQVSSALVGLEAKEQQLVAAYRQQGGALIAQRDELAPSRKALAARVEPSVLSTYERIAKAKNGIALCKLTESTCSACRAKFDESRVLRLRSEAPLTTCPSCGRMMVVDKSYRG